MIDLCKRFGTDVVEASFDSLLERNKRAMQSLIETQIPETAVSFEDFIDDDGQGMGPSVCPLLWPNIDRLMIRFDRWKVKCTMLKRLDVATGVTKLHFDFDGTEPQSVTSINFTLSPEMWKMFVGIYLITVFDPSIIVKYVSTPLPIPSMG